MRYGVTGRLPRRGRGRVRRRIPRSGPHRTPGSGVRRSRRIGPHRRPLPACVECPAPLPSELPAPVSAELRAPAPAGRLPASTFDKPLTPVSTEPPASLFLRLFSVSSGIRTAPG
ncbi:hypothetical protein STRTUCAR8_00243 [Streptomyces turgidiscabies Car8]|uniref:Uncharacterized protein n=1 Tax=Streptomyces turgidiscabies (strain Car8) TaxID=698760 RepID=L7F0N6_STRT8|nr:hypothetical protein STRTUCAR8_00243 [Streptomyces turgidiscabies Car8]